MIRQLTQFWWVLVLRGVLAILFGALAFAWPGLTLEVLVILFGAYALTDGVFALVAAFGPSRGRIWPLVLEGVTGIAAGLLTFAWPGLTGLILLYFIAGWAIATGVLELVAAVQLRAVIADEFWLALSGVLSIVLGVWALFQPGEAAVALAWVIGAYAVVFGVTLIALGLRLRSWHARGLSAVG